MWSFPSKRNGVWLFIITGLIIHSFALIFQFGENGRCISPRHFVDHQNPKATFELQNVRGDGDCIFLAATWLLNVDGVREKVCDIFREGTHVLDVTPETKVSAAALLQQAAFEMNCSRQEYLDKLGTPGRDGGLYGGGPELVVLSHLLKCSIGIYEVYDGENSDGEHDTTLQPVICRGVFGRHADRDEISARRNILIVNTTIEKHACILIPTGTNATAPHP